ncbi:hypothetical protein QTP88_011479 [Uroleucon formosanum]
MKESQVQNWKDLDYGLIVFAHYLILMTRQSEEFLSDATGFLTLSPGDIMKSKDFSYIVATQIMYTITFLGTLASAVGSSMFFLCCTPEKKRFNQITQALGITLIASGICAAISVLIFALFANRPGWMPGHDNNFFGWTFGVAIASFFALLGSGAFYLVETHTQLKKRKYLKESQTKFDIEFIE